MSTFDAPDWQHIVTINNSPTVSDSPDWQTVVTGPGGTIVQGFAGDGWLPQSYGVGAWTFPPYVPTVQNNAFTNGRIYMTLLPVGANCTVSRVCISFVAPLTGPVANENYIGIYETDNTGTNQFVLVGATAAGTCDVSFLANQTMQYINFASAINLTAGNQYWLSLLSNGSSNTLKVLVSNLNQTPQPNGGLFGTDYTLGANHYSGVSVANNPTGTFTTLPNPFNPAFSLTGGQAVYAQLLP